MKPSPPSPQAAIDLLQSYGYQIRYHQQQWWTCALLGPGTAILGHGVDAAAALEHALGQLLPNDLARALWAEKVAPRSQMQPDNAESAAAAESADSATVAPALAESAAENDEPTVQLAANAAGTGQLGPLAVAMVEAAAPLAAPVEPKPAAPVKAKPALPPASGVALAGIDRAMAAMDALEREVEETDDFPLLSAELMQLQLVAWIAVARDWQDRKNDDELTQRVSGFAARMGRMARRYWPGQVAALRLEARPEECAALVGGQPRSWAEVADLASQAMAEETGLDEYGWADANKLGPQPRDPRSRLGEAQASLRKLLPGADEPDTAASRRCLIDLKAKPPLDEIAAIARKLRWLRLSADPEPWGRAMGWLRWLAQRLGPAIPPAVVALFQPETLPARDWAKDNGFQPQRGEVRKLVAELPAALAPREEVLDWFKRAVSLMDATELTERLRGHRTALLAMDAHELLPGKDNGTARDRLRKVQKRLAGPVVALPQLPMAPLDEETCADPAEASPVDRARALVAGHKALVLGNRMDPHLDRHLRAGLGLAELDWCHTDQSSGLEAAADRVRNHAYDIVLGLTGFISHASEAVLRQACAAGSVPFIRAGKGRLVGCAVAILRDLGDPAGVSGSGGKGG